jgi:primosomal protein N' (replication factor Y)
MKNDAKDLFIDVALSLPLTKHLHYKIPAQLKSSVAVGKRVLVPLGKRRVTGYVVDLLHRSEFPEIKDIVDVLDDQPLFTPQHLKFYRWISDYYFFPLGGVIKTALPSSINIESKQVITLTEKGTAALTEEKSSPPMLLLKALSKKNQLSYTTLRKSYRGEGLYALLMHLEQRGLITRELKENSAAVKVKQEKWIRLEEKGDHLLKSPTLLGPWEKKAPKQASFLRFLGTRREASLPVLQEAFGSCSRIIENLEANGLVSSSWKEVYRDPLCDEAITAEKTHQPNAEQREIIQRITESTAAGKYAPFLLHGVTASGKTEVYLHTIEEVLKRGKEALVLVPEISLTPQLVNRFRLRFGDAIALFHSRLSPGERYDGWRRIQQGKVKIAIGTRSAIYAPFTRLGIIIVDEEHDASYKQEEQLRYNARDLALVRGKMDDATVVLGSATPSLESYYNSQVGKCTLLTLTERVEGKPLPTIEIVDMKLTFSQSSWFCSLYHLLGMRSCLRVPQLQRFSHPPSTREAIKMSLLRIHHS